MAANTNYLQWNYGVLDQFFDGSVGINGVSNYYFHPFICVDNQTQSKIIIPQVGVFNNATCPPARGQTANTFITLPGTTRYYFRIWDNTNQNVGQTMDIVGTAGSTYFFDLKWNSKPRWNGVLRNDITIGDSALARYYDTFLGGTLYTFCATFKPASCWSNLYAEQTLSIFVRLVDGSMQNIGTPHYFTYVTYDQTYT